jgi:hypothetical protein
MKNMIFQPKQQSNPTSKCCNQSTAFCVCMTMKNGIVAGNALVYDGAQAKLP